MDSLNENDKKSDSREDAGCSGTQNELPHGGHAASRVTLCTAGLVT